MRRAPAGPQDESLKRPAASDEVASVLGGLRHEDVSVFAGLGLNQGTGARATELLVRDEEKCDGQRDRLRALDEQAERVAGEKRPSLHVEYPRPVDDVAFSPKWKVARERLRRMDSIQMR